MKSKIMLTKAILGKMTTTEVKKFNDLNAKLEKSIDIMVKKQALFSQTERKNPNSKQLGKLLNAGFKAEFDTIKVKDKLYDFIAKMKSKY